MTSCRRSCDPSSIYGGGGTSTALGLRPFGGFEGLGASDALFDDPPTLSLIVGRAGGGAGVEEALVGVSTGNGGGGGIILAGTDTESLADPASAASTVLLIRAQAIRKHEQPVGCEPNF
jgi:hypothetical protein